MLRLCYVGSQIQSVGIHPTNSKLDRLSSLISIDYLHRVTQLHMQANTKKAAGSSLFGCGGHPHCHNQPVYAQVGLHNVLRGLHSPLIFLPFGQTIDK